MTWVPLWTQSTYGAQVLRTAEDSSRQEWKQEAGFCAVRGSQSRVPGINRLSMEDWHTAFISPVSSGGWRVVSWGPVWRAVLRLLLTSEWKKGTSGE